MADAVCLFLGNGHAYSKQQRVAIDPDNPDVVPFTENDRTLVPVRFISEQLGAEVNYDGATEQVSVKKDGIEIDMTIGSNTVYKNGQAVTLDVAANTYNDRTFVPLRACAELLNKQVYWHDMGLIVISDKENIYDDDKDLGVLYTIIQNIIFDRPTGEQMMADLRAQNPDDAHPRLLANAQQIAQIKERAKTDSVLQSWIDSIEKSSQGILEQPTVEFIDKLGYDNGMLTVARTAKEKLYKMAFLYQFTGEDKYAARAWKELEEICSWPDWHPDTSLTRASCLTVYRSRMTGATTTLRRSSARRLRTRSTETPLWTVSGRTMVRRTRWTAVRITAAAGQRRRQTGTQSATRGC